MASEVEYNSYKNNILKITLTSMDSYIDLDGAFSTSDNLITRYGPIRRLTISGTDSYPGATLTIGGYAFYANSATEDFTVSGPSDASDLKIVLGNECFRNASNIIDVSLFKYVSEIGVSAFEGARGVVADLMEYDIVVGNLTSIKAHAFQNLGNSISTLSLHQGLTEIADTAFSGTTVTTIYNFTDLNIVKGASTYGEIAKNSETVYTRYKYVFRNGSSLPECKSYERGSSQSYVPTSTQTFKGWFTAEEGGTQYTGSDGAFTATGNMRLFAQWNTGYTVSLTEDPGAQSNYTILAHYNYGTAAQHNLRTETPTFTAGEEIVIEINRESVAEREIEYWSVNGVVQSTSEWIDDINENLTVYVKYKYRARSKSDVFKVNPYYPNGTISAEPDQSTYDINSTVTLTAVPNDPEHMTTEWTLGGSVYSTDNPLTYTVPETGTLLCNMMYIEYPLSVSCDVEGLIDKTEFFNGSGDRITKIAYGKYVDVRIYPASSASEDYTFVKIKDNLGNEYVLEDYTQSQSCYKGGITSMLGDGTYTLIYKTRKTSAYNVTKENADTGGYINIEMGTNFSLGGLKSSTSENERSGFYIEGATLTLDSGLGTIKSSERVMYVGSESSPIATMWHFTVGPVGSGCSAPRNCTPEWIKFYYNTAGTDTRYSYATARMYALIKLDANGGSVSTDTFYCYSDGITLPEPTLSGYKFKHWYNEDYNRTYQAGVLTNAFPTSMTLTAVWVKSYNVTYSNVRSGTNPNKTVLTAEDFPYTLTDCTWDSYHRFLGWYMLNSAGSYEKVTQLTELKDYTGTSAIYAQWESDEDLESLEVYRNTVQVLNQNTVQITDGTSVTLSVKPVPYTAVVDKYAWSVYYYNPNANGYVQFDSTVRMAKIYLNPTSSGDEKYLCASSGDMCGDEDIVGYDGSTPITMAEYISLHGNYDPRTCDDYQIVVQYGSTQATIPVHFNDLVRVTQFNTDEKDRVIIQVLGENTNDVYTTLYQVDLNTVTKCSESYTIKTTQTPIPSYKADAAFTMDRGISEQISVSFVHAFNPPTHNTSYDEGTEDEPYDFMRWGTNNPYGMLPGTPVSADYWSNQFFDKVMTKLINRWQMMTDGCKFLFLPRKCSDTHGRNARVIGTGVWNNTANTYDYYGANAYIKSYETDTEAGSPDQIKGTLSIYIGGMNVNYV